MRATLTVEGSSLHAIFCAAGSVLQDQLIAEMSAILRGQGYVVEKSLYWETPKEFCARIGICGQTLIRKLRDPRCPKVDHIRGPSQRLLYIAATKRFEAFCTSGPKPKAKAEDAEIGFSSVPAVPSVP